MLAIVTPPQSAANAALAHASEPTAIEVERSQDFMRFLRLAALIDEAIAAPQRG